MLKTRHLYQIKAVLLSAQAELPQRMWYKLSHADMAYDQLAPQILQLPYRKTRRVGVS